MAIIYPNTETEGIDSKDRLKKSINPVEKNKFGIKRMKKVSKGGVLLKVSTKEDYEKLKLEI